MNPLKPKTSYWTPFGFKYKKSYFRAKIIERMTNRVKKYLKIKGEYSNKRFKSRSYVRRRKIGIYVNKEIRLSYQNSSLRRNK